MTSQIGHRRSRLVELKLTRPAILTAIALWLGSGIVGGLYAGWQADNVYTVELSADRCANPNERGKGTQSWQRMDRIILIKTIFFRNCAVAAIMAMGTLSFGLTAAVASIQNGAVLGYLVVAATNTAMGWKAIAWALLPHAVIELPALIMAAALGLQGLAVFRRWIDGDLKTGDFRGPTGILCIVTVLLGVAAVIEVTVSISGRT